MTPGLSHQPQLPPEGSPTTVVSTHLAHLSLGSLCCLSCCFTIVSLLFLTATMSQVNGTYRNVGLTQRPAQHQQQHQQQQQQQVTTTTPQMSRDLINAEKTHQPEPKLSIADFMFTDLEKMLSDIKNV